MDSNNRNKCNHWNLTRLGMCSSIVFVLLLCVMGKLIFYVVDIGEM